MQTTANKLLEAIAEGYGELEADWSTPDHKMLEKLVENVYSFSGAKNYQQLNDITQQLVGEDGKLREVGDFREAVEELGFKYNKTWLQTEYDSAVANATASARWVEFEQEAELFPMLIYQTAGDNKVRATHRALDGIIRHISDEFWDTYYPPNGWNCRCEALQMPDSDTKASNIPTELPSVQAMFRTNIAKEGLLFPKNHPYYDGVPKDVIRRSMQYLPKDYAFRTMDGFDEHAMLQHEAEAGENRTIARILAGSGEKDIKLMPRLHEKDKKTRTKIYGKEYCDAHPTKCPDGWMNGEAVEFKEVTKRNLSRRIHEASEQADVVVIKTKEILTEGYIEMFTKGQWTLDDRLNVKRIIIINNNKVHKFDRPEPS